MNLALYVTQYTFMGQYRLLRNNKETGPYTADELIKSGFKKYDLIWAEGKSAAWRYPGELPEFKPYAPVLEDQPFDRFYKKPGSLNPQKNETASIQGPEINIIPALQPKPRIKIKADCKKIEATGEHKPVAKNILRSPQTEQITTPEWKDMWLDWEQEKKAVAGSPQNNNKSNNTPPLEIKYAQSLDEIKERYIENVLSTKNKPANNKNNNYWVAAMLIACILVTGIWMGIKWSGSSSAKTESLKSDNGQELPIKTADIQSSDYKETNPAAEDIKLNTTAVSRDEIAENKATKKNETVYVPALQNEQVGGTATGRKIKMSTGRGGNDNTSLVNQKKSSIIEKNGDAGLVKTTDNFITPIHNKATQNSAALPAQQSDEVVSIFRPSEREPEIQDYISVKSYTPYQTVATGVRYTVQNISEIKIDLVMIDLQYYDNNGNYEKGETVYVRNINAGQNVTIDAPEYSKAAKINYKVSMISAETKKLYLIAD